MIKEGTMRKLSILTATIGSVLVLIPHLALPFPVKIDATNNSCTFLDNEGLLVTVTPAKLKVVQRGGNSSNASCEDATEEAGLTTDGGKPITCEGGGYQCNCTIRIFVDGEPTVYCATMKEKIDKNGATMTCEAYKP
jgi:hypothetical protein